MPWTKGDYPDSLKNFEPRTRNKAVEIANALLEDGYEEGRAIAIATSQAKEWAEDHPDSSRKAKQKRKREEDNNNLHVLPFDGKWAVKAEGADEPELVVDTKAKAVKEALKLASEDNLSAIIHREDGTIQTSHNYK
ncbi:DUF2188 domain-containing protein [Paenibacillus sp. GP183]|uniref:DUF2188 domain-containing protein n=1 Tax=Paenibacillus sp. GP183 TaxID=1882751 RepID=UPI0008985F69|nr:DUF2188 domain-containing protein [Paenibacillus sp. GP183]SEC26282.1 Uncharacterized protein YdaT [Paenibacillus sp. GP183]